MGKMFTANEIARVTGGRLVGADNTVSGVSTDTRTINAGDLFIAIKGERFDGNDYIGSAAGKGAVLALSDREEEIENCGIPVVYVKDCRAAQLALAGYYRKKFAAKVCGVTGSVGKTSTKDMIYAALSAKYRTLKTEGNFNNDIGLPRTLFGLSEEYGAAVIEMGMSGRGEISALSKTAAPDIAVITNIGWCHIAMLGTRENILAAKLEILDGMTDNAPLILNGDDEYLSTVRLSGRKIIRFGMGNSLDVRAEEIDRTENGESFVITDGEKRYHAEVPAIGEHHVLNALAAFCVGTELGMEPDEIIPALMNYIPSGMRQHFEKRGEVSMIMDCYNASPDSMKSSLSVLGEMSGRRIAVLGDMLELGEKSAELHAKIAEYVKKSADLCFLYGREMTACYDELKKGGFPAYHSIDKAEIAKAVRDKLKDGDNVLFKGSRGMKMEEIAGLIWGAEQ